MLKTRWLRSGMWWMRLYHERFTNRLWIRNQNRALGDLILICNEKCFDAKGLNIWSSEALHEAQRMCAELVVLSSDYEPYSLFSKRMFDIARRFRPMVEEYSIDEGFASRRACGAEYGADCWIASGRTR